MATLTRPRIVDETTDTSLRFTIPAPFPRNLIEQDRYLLENNLSPPPSNNAYNGVLEEQSRKAVVLEQDTAPVQSGSSKEEIELVGSTQEILPSIANVQASCLMILNNLLLPSNPWQFPVPGLQHNTEGPDSTSCSKTQPPLTLYTLILNLRQQDHDHDMSEISSSGNNAALIVELGKRVQKLANSSALIPIDAELAHSVVSLLAHLDRLSILRSSNPLHSFPQSPTKSQSIQAGLNAFDTLKRSLNELQTERLSRSSSPSLQTDQSPVLAVEAALLWSRIDSDLEDVLSICRQRTEGLEPALPPGLEQLPPEYQYDEDLDYETLPEYDRPESPITQDSEHTKFQLLAQQNNHGTTSQSTDNEKLKLDLEAVTVAIDRLYLSAPQLHNQRVELKKSKVEEMEKARSSGKAKGKQKQNDMKDLDDMLSLIGRASERRLVNQSVVLEGGLEARLAKAKRRDIEKRQAFVEQLVKHSDAGRLHDQDAVLHNPKTRDPKALLTLPEFMREYVPTKEMEVNPETVLTLPEFIKEPVPETVSSVLPAPISVPTVGGGRGRSLSTSSLSWIFSSTSRLPPSCVLEKESHRKKRPATSSGPFSVSSTGFDLRYIAEHHENLQHVMVFFNVTGAVAGHNLEAEIYSGIDGQGQLVLRSGLKTTPPVNLPARLVPGKQEVKVQSGHFELKLPTILPDNLEGSEPEHTELLDATSLTASSPTTFLCSSCSLPLVQSTKVREYKDLPSEHWEELVDAWMCHSDQKLHDHVVKHASKGFWPMEGQALVGGSYIVFEKGSVTENNLVHMDGNKLVTCLTTLGIQGENPGSYSRGHILSCFNEKIGRACDAFVELWLADARDRPLITGGSRWCIAWSNMQFDQPLRIPLSAFVVRDMQEYVHAHATYRFILHDEEDERPRILIWLFKPSIGIAYTAPTAYILPQAGCINAAKVLFKLLGPNADLDSIVSSYPGFPQAEHLLYPLDICHRLAGLLRESNGAYPESMRMMTGLEVGFLQRA